MSIVVFFWWELLHVLGRLPHEHWLWPQAALFEVLVLRLRHEPAEELCSSVGGFGGEERNQLPMTDPWDPWYIYLHEWLVSMAIPVGKYNIHGSNGLINVTSVKWSKIWKNAFFFVGVFGNILPVSSSDVMCIWLPARGQIKCQTLSGHDL